MKTTRIPLKLAIYLLKLYQKTLSPDHSLRGKTRFPLGFCRFSPSCSQYSIDVIQKYGFLKGSVRSLGRLLRCHPFSQGGYDPA